MRQGGEGPHRGMEDEEERKWDAPAENHHVLPILSTPRELHLLEKLKKNDRQNSGKIENSGVTNIFLTCSTGFWLAALVKSEEYHLGDSRASNGGECALHPRRLGLSDRTN